MVAKKSETKKTTAGSKKVVSEKKTTTKKVAEKVAIKKLSSEVSKAKNEIIKEKKDQETKKEQVEGKEVKAVKKVVLPKFNSNEKTQNVGKIGEIKHGVAYATGRRKRAIAKVSCKEKSGKLSISVNNLDYKQFFTKLLHQDIVIAPFALLGIKTGYVVNAEVFGGGKSGQADALKLGLSRCLSVLSEEYAQVLRKNSFLTRDNRKVEPKKAGLKKARKKEQFSKR